MLLVTGFALQWVAGPADFYLLTFPFNLIGGLAILLLGGLLAAFRRTPVCAWLIGPQLAAGLLAGLLFLSLIMGLFLQTGPDKAAGIAGRLGLRSSRTAGPLSFSTHCFSSPSPAPRPRVSAIP